MSLSELRGTALRIGDKLIIDRYANVILSNIYCENVTGALTTPSLTEASSMKGITVFGNLIISSGHTLSVDTLFGDLFVDGSIKVHDQIITNRFTSSRALIDTISTEAILAKNGKDISIIGNVALLESGASFSGTLVTSQIRCVKGLQINANGQVTIDRGCLSVNKSVSAPSHTNIVVSDTPAGIVYYVSPPTAPQTIAKVKLLNKYIQPDSIVMAIIGSYAGQDKFIVQSSVPSLGAADIFVCNTVYERGIPPNIMIPIQYFIVG